jgi:hypothetical protein
MLLFLKYFRQKFGENIGVFDSKKAKLLNILILTLVFEKTPILSPKVFKNRGKLRP